MFGSTNRMCFAINESEGLYFMHTELHLKQSKVTLVSRPAAHLAGEPQCRLPYFHIKQIPLVRDLFFVNFLSKQEFALDARREETSEETYEGVR